MHEMRNTLQLLLLFKKQTDPHTQTYQRAMLILTPNIICDVSLMTKESLTHHSVSVTSCY